MHLYSFYPDYAEVLKIRKISLGLATCSLIVTGAESDFPWEIVYFIGIVIAALAATAYVVIKGRKLTVPILKKR